VAKNEGNGDGDRQNLVRVRPGLPRAVRNREVQAAINFTAAKPSLKLLGAMYNYPHKTHRRVQCPFYSGKPDIDPGGTTPLRRATFKPRPREDHWAGTGQPRTTYPKRK
jgi:hypothetical protein